MRYDNTKEGWEDLTNRIKNCERCVAGKNCINKVLPIGARDAPVMVIGDIPSGEEEVRSTPFVGIQGRMLRKLFHLAGFVKGDLYLTKVVKCKVRSKSEADECAGKCFMFWYEEMERLSPKLILTVGEFSFKVFTDSKKSLGSVRGEFIPKHGRLVLPLWHPGYAMNAGELRKKELQRDIHNAYRKVFT